MVSSRSRNFVLIGIGVLIVAFLSNRVLNKPNLITQDEIITPTLLAPDPVKEIQVNPQINILREAIKGVQNFIKTTFKAPILTKGLTTGGKTFPCRGPNCLGIFQAKGTITSFDPFTGQRVAVGQTFRGTSKALSFLGSAASLTANQLRVTQGGDLATQARNIIKDLQGQLNILQTNSV